MYCERRIFSIFILEIYTETLSALSGYPKSLPKPIETVNTEKIRTTWKYKRCFVSWLRTPSRGSLRTISSSLFGQRTQTFHISAFLLCSGIPPTGILNNQVLYLIKSVHRLMVKNLWWMLPKYFKFIFQKWRIRLDQKMGGQPAHPLPTNARAFAMQIKVVINCIIFFFLVCTQLFFVIFISKIIRGLLLNFRHALEKMVLALIWPHGMILASDHRDIVDFV